MEGRTKGLQKMQNYEDGFVRRAGKAIYESMCEPWRKKEFAKIVASQIMVAEETKEEKETMEVTKDKIDKSKTHSKKALCGGEATSTARSSWTRLSCLR